MCQDNNLSLNDRKSKELIMDYIDRAVVKWVGSFKFLCVHITKDPSWSTHTNTVVKRAQKCLFPLRRLKRFGMGP